MEVQERLLYQRGRALSSAAPYAKKELVMDKMTETLVDAILPHVAFDGWSEASFRAALEDTGADPVLARARLPRGAVDLAVAYHRRSDAHLAETLRSEDLSELRFRDRITHAVRLRLGGGDREAIRRAATLFSLPHHAATGAALVWETADTIWTALGDSSTDANWYSKRAILSGVYSATLLYWLGDQSEDHADTWAFLDRRIEGVMQFEKLKADVNKSALLKPLVAGPAWLLSQVKAPSQSRARRPGYQPGYQGEK